MIDSLVLTQREAQCACQHGHAETVQISWKSGVSWRVMCGALADIHHHVLKTTTKKCEEG